ncbi:protein WEAK CHLOROPLAST MOVEMENT UNDER BLUE LIGHT 1-like [Cornus florida]|uniref:protein WEAK CHLOROPLAST MOVEMENT UNDER BLUE LIGHT 1-like n=1 Tax=Cornus florida TaxID=4283 RepID=UPI002899915A|nr:protein WEAK CHLOROPLAST MOVEMENT UNDER BLUE LIGHT 1-like [Cornus florida]
MGEIDTKSIESVQAALSFFGEKNDPTKNLSTGSNEMEKERELEVLLKDLAINKVQLEAKDTAYKQALLQLDHYQTASDEFFTLLKNSKFEKDIYINECRVARMKKDELEFKMGEMASQLSETLKVREQLSNVISELRATQGELLNVETELATAIELKLEAMMQTELMETELDTEKLKMEELLRHVSELNETILHLKMAATEAEEEKCRVLSEKEAELEYTTASVVDAQKQLENMRKQLEVMHDLESQLMAKSVFIDSMQLQIQQVNELQSSSERTVTDAIKDLNQLALDLEMQEKKNSNQAVYIKSLEMELNQLKLELENANEEVSRLNCSVEMTTDELEKVKNEVEEIKGSETEAQIEIAMLKSELHRGRSKIAAAEVAEARAKSEKSGLYLAVQQLAMEAEAAKKEKRELMEETQKALMKMAEKANQVPEPVLDNSYEVEILMRELETAKVRIGELRVRAEQAISRAEAAEKGKAALEDQLKKWRERRERRKAAIAALQEECILRESSSFKYEPLVPVPKTYQPLGKVLNMEF